MATPSLKTIYFDSSPLTNVHVYTIIMACISRTNLKDTVFEINKNILIWGFVNVSHGKINL